MKREALDRLAERYGLDRAAVAGLEALLEGLASEADPPTSVHEPEAALDVHIADGLTALDVPQLRAARRIADIGAGAGFPGLVLAAAVPHARVDLIESVKRKAEVIERLASRAGLASRARAIASRAEDWAASEGREAYDAVTARALASLPVLAEYAAPLLRQGGVLVAWKGSRDNAEERSGERAAAIVGLAPAAIRETQPFPESRDRHLYVYSKVKATPNRFPRRAGMAVKRPLA